LRVSSDLIYLYFAIDDHTDPEPEHIVRQWVDVMKDALLHPEKPRPEGEVFLGQLTKESVSDCSTLLLLLELLTLHDYVHRFIERAAKVATPKSLEHFKESFAEYLEANVVHAQHRDRDIVQTVEEYLGPIRRNDVGARSIFFSGEIALNVPDEAYYHPIIKELQDLSLDMVTIDNVRSSFHYLVR
jgi:hypothetical protein